MNEIRRIVGLVISLVIFLVSAIVGFVFFGIAAVFIVGILLFFFLLWVLIYLNRKFRYFVFHLKKNAKQAGKKEKRNTKKKWKEEQVVVGHIEE